MTPTPAPLRADTLRHIDEVLVRCPALAGLRDEIARAAAAICACHRAGGKLLVCGNGGSAADCEHIVGELVKSFVLPRALPPADAARLSASSDDGARTLAGKLQRGVAAISLTGHPSLATAIHNDTGGDLIFAQQVYVYGRPGDLVLALSTSGNSINVLHALDVARAFGLTTLGLTGNRPCRMDALCDILLKVPEQQTHQVQELHLPVYHTLCLMVEQELFAEGSLAP